METPILVRELEPGRRIELWQYLYNLRLMLVEEGFAGPEIVSQFCYQRPELALVALAVWDGEGKPHGWFKDVQTQEYQREFAADAS